MNQEMFDRAVALAERRQHVLIATVDLEGVPHIASVGSFAAEADGLFVLEDWFCPATLANLNHSAQIVVLVWDVASDVGYQFVGRVEAVRERGPVEGHVPGARPHSPQPDAERALYVRAGKVLAFSHAPLSDEEEPETRTALFPRATSFLVPVANLNV